MLIPRPELKLVGFMAEPKVWAAAKEFAYQKRVSVAAVVREALRGYLSMNGISVK